MARRSTGGNTTPVLIRPSNTYHSTGILRPCNRWRSRTHSHALQRAQILASKVPHVTRYNHMRS